MENDIINVGGMNLMGLDDQPLKQQPAPELVNVELASAGWVNKYVLTYKLEDGSLYEYEAASRKELDDFRAGLEADARGEKPRPDAVCIVPILPGDRLLLIREFRYPLNAWCTAFPAGLLEPGETIRECVERELHEEVGCRLIDDVGSALTALPQSGFSSTGMTDENVQIVFARVEYEGEAQPERGELIYPFILAYDDVADFMKNSTDLIGTRAQLVLEMVRRIHMQKGSQPQPQARLTRQDYA